MTFCSHRLLYQRVVLTKSIHKNKKRIKLNSSLALKRLTITFPLPFYIRVWYTHYLLFFACTIYMEKCCCCIFIEQEGSTVNEMMKTDSFVYFKAIQLVRCTCIFILFYQKLQLLPIIIYGSFGVLRFKL